MRTEGHDRVERVGGVRPSGSSPTTRTSCFGKTKPPGPVPPLGVRVICSFVPAYPVGDRMPLVTRAHLRLAA
jgi:hypothetical protein